MKMEPKRVLDFSGAPSGGNRLKVLLIGRTEVECVELQAGFTPLQEIAVETLMTIGRLPADLQKTATPPDIVLVDISADSSEDLTLLRDLRKIAVIDHTPIVAIIDRMEDDSPLRVMRAGADDVLLKPIDTKEARDVFARVMNHSRHSRSGSTSLGTSRV